MTIKEFLREIRRKSTSIEILNEQIERVRSMVEYRGSVIDPNGGGYGTKDPHSREKLLIRLTELSEKLEELKVSHLDDIERANEMVLSLSDEKMIQIFYKRYFKYQTWEAIANDMNLTFQWVHELHKRGLIELSARYPFFPE
ncbi:MAG: hypothetical protein ACI4NM_05360 [Bullifex sp.]